MKAKLARPEGRALAAIFLLCFGAGALYLANGWRTDLFLNGQRSICPLRWLTGRLCPGCGMTRAFFALGQGMIREAVAYNLFSPVLFAGGLLWLFTPWLDGAFKSRRILWLALLGAGLFWILRNR